MVLFNYTSYKIASSPFGNRKGTVRGRTLETTTGTNTGGQSESEYKIKPCVHMTIFLVTGGDLSAVDFEGAEVLRQLSSLLVLAVKHLNNRLIPSWEGQGG